MTNETKELKTYTMQELYEHPLEPMACLVDGLLAPGCVAGSVATQLSGGCTEKAAVSWCVPGNRH